MKDLIAEFEAWDDGDFTVTLRPEKAPAWTSVPVGTLLNKEQAKLISQWLQNALPTIQKIIVQTESDPTM
jgi:hypothetical protein